MVGAGAMLDLGGIAKGWAIDEIVEALRKEGVTSAYVDWCVDTLTLRTQSIDSGP